ncbi:alpha/beta fold hydrolase [Streptomyces sp. RY43-2]|uniref:Alpha/beta fold hydrolase n=1 Tax=Streptomyces macrolidinus TaxID=2952607 RepID=A0ABT0ZMY6_9ACTN|nr:alpha/beta fold hydrolase [Streptomyces macrolidinus]MCN9244951.1 alpha/beta fold hydrolase [Streptomyces macrolidinus]
MTQNPSRSQLWIRTFHPAPGAATRLVCLPHAGGSASFYFPASRALSPAIEVLAVQYPGRQDRRIERCLETITELADAITEELLPLTDKSLALFGHSMGATIAFEVAQRLEDHGIKLSAIFLSGRRAPSIDRPENLHLLDDRALLEALKEIGGTDAAILEDEELMRMSIGAIRGDYKAISSYRWQRRPPLRTPIHVHVGDTDPQVSRTEAQAWAQHTTGEFSLSTYSGGHFYINEHAPRLLGAISGRLADSVEGGPAL